MKNVCAALTLGLALLGCATARVEDAVDPSTLMKDLTTLAADDMQGRAAGTPGGAAAARYITGRLEAIGYAPQSVPFTYTTRGNQPGAGVNIVARIEGTDPDPNGRVIVFSAHYDHLGVRDGAIHNGADDNASGVAALLAVAEALRKQPPVHDVIFVAFDAEEAGLRGARAFVANPPVAKERLALNINLDMVGRDDGGALYIAGLSHYPQLAPVLKPLAERAPVKLLFGHDTPEWGQEDWTMQSDHAPFHQAQIPFVYFGVEGHADYHKPGDDAEKIKPAFFSGAVRTILMATRALDQGL